MGLEQGLAFKVAGAFGGGMARMGETCGAVTGALMAIGLKYGMTKAKDEGARDKTYKLAQELVTRFKERHRSIICRELLGYDLSNPEGRKAAHDKGLFTTLCPKFVRDAVEIVEQLL
ncbi:MAG: C-GCAxxG-C-C family protein [Desulfobacterales bacterium]|nr:C-GCAxxG-C-C family protein [Desulfobacterales bacterium]